MITTPNGGTGAVKHAVEHLLKASNYWVQYVYQQDVNFKVAESAKKAACDQSIEALLNVAYFIGADRFQQAIEQTLVANGFALPGGPMPEEVEA